MLDEQVCIAAQELDMVGGGFGIVVSMSPDDEANEQPLQRQLL